VTNSPQRDPADSRNEACRSVPAQSRTATCNTANEVRQGGPPTDTARLLRQSESANQRAPTVTDQLTPPGTCRSSHRSVPISPGSIPRRHRLTPPTRSAKQVRQLTPPGSAASQRAPTRERQLSVTNSPHREPADPRIEACRSVAAQSRTATGDTANEVRQGGPPTDTARFPRQSESANQRALTVSDQLTPTGT
jgi:hypothetical protein